jgi:hypothetical protein
MNKTLIVKEWLEKGNTITDMKAVEICQSYRLSGIIYNLRHIYGMNIRDRWKENENTKVKYKEYYLEEE